MTESTMGEGTVGGAVTEETVTMSANGVTGGQAPRAEAVADEREAATQVVASNPVTASAVQSAATGVVRPAESRSSGMHDARQQPANRIQGHVEIADDVVEKIAAIAAYEVEGVADLGGGFARAWESLRERIGIGDKRDDQGVRAQVTDRDAEVDLKIVVQYGHVVRDVAYRVQANVAHRVQRMLGLRVQSVDVRVEDVEMPDDFNQAWEQRQARKNDNGMVDNGEYPPAR